MVEGKAVGEFPRAQPEKSVFRHVLYFAPDVFEV
jgi:hypothetical protein